jgi:hypothetical protein
MAGGGEFHSLMQRYSFLSRPEPKVSPMDTVKNQLLKFLEPPSDSSSSED